MENVATTVPSSVKDLMAKGTVRTSETIFKKVLHILRTSYSNLINDKSITVDYGTCQITLN